MKCPQCGADVREDEWNCPSCRINIYWAKQHYDELARIRGEHGVGAAAATPAFLIKTHRDAMDERADRGGRFEHRVRRIARAALRRRR